MPSSQMVVSTLVGSGTALQAVLVLQLDYIPPLMSLYQVLENMRTFLIMITMRFGGTPFLQAKSLFSLAAQAARQDIQTPQAHRQSLMGVVD